MPKRSSSLESAAARRKLAIRKKSYFTLIAPNISLGYRRNAGGAGSWSVRSTQAGGDWIRKLAIADDLEPANNEDVLSYWQAQQRAREITRRPAGPANADPNRPPVTLDEALDVYRADLVSRDADVANARRMRRHLTPTMRSTPIVLLTVSQLRGWRDQLLAGGLKPASFNRTAGALKAAIETCAVLDPRIGAVRETIKQGLRRIRGANTARRLVLDDATVSRIVRAARELDERFGTLVWVLAESGARVSQAARVNCGDLLAAGPDSQLLIPASRKGSGQKQRAPVAAPISRELADVLERARGDRGPDEPLLVKADGRRWLQDSKSEVWSAFRLVVASAGLDPDEVTAYALRHSAICRRLRAGISVHIVSRWHDTSAATIESNYSRYILDVSGGDVGRRGLLQVTPSDNVVALRTNRS